MTGWSTVEACGKPLLDDIQRTLNAETREPIDNPVANFAAQGNVVGVARQTIPHLPRPAKNSVLKTRPRPSATGMAN